MANSKISALTSATTPLAGTETLPVVQSSTTKQVSVANLTAGRAVSAASLALTTALPTTSGGTGLSSFSANQIFFASSTSAIGQSSNLSWNGSGLGVGISSASYLFDFRSGSTATTGQFSSTNTTAYSAGGYNGGIARVFLTGGNATGAANGFEFTAGGNNENFLGVVQEAGGSGALVFQTYDGSAYGERHRISSTGIVTMPAYGSGAATFSASGVISSVSDETWKIKDGVPIDTDSMLKKLEPGYWYYNEEKKETFGKDRQLGFYAQNVNAAIGPEAAPEPENGKPWGYYDRSVLAVVVMSLQKALDTIDSLRVRIEALEKV
jgi:hypothetical protein